RLLRSALMYSLAATGRTFAPFPTAWRAFSLHLSSDRNHGVTPSSAPAGGIVVGHKDFAQRIVVRHERGPQHAGPGSLCICATTSPNAVTYDFARQMEGATEIKCSQFGDNIIAHM